MTYDEANAEMSKMWPLTQRYWKASSKSEKANICAEWKSIWRKVEDAGYKISKKKIYEYGNLKRIDFKVSCPKKNNIKLVYTNMSPDGKSHGDCTTRAIAYLLRGKRTYEQIRRAQDKNSARVFGSKSHWNCPEAYNPVLSDNGYVRIHLDHKKTRATLAKMLVSVEEPIFTESATHVAVLENGKLIDTWNSGGGHVENIWARPAAAKRIKTILAAN